HDARRRAALPAVASAFRVVRHQRPQRRHPRSDPCRCARRRDRRWPRGRGVSRVRGAPVVTFTPLRDLPDTLVEITVNGRPVAARAGIPLALALLEGGLEAFNRSPVDGTPRRPYCLMGACL